MKDKIVLIKNINSKRKLNKFKNKSIDTICLKDNIYYGSKEYENNISIRNLEIDYKAPKMYMHSANFYLHNPKCENVYFKNEDNLGGITLNFSHLIKNNINRINFYWHPTEEKISNIKEINIITPDKISKINLIKEELKEIEIMIFDNKMLRIDIENIHSKKRYEIDMKGKLEEETIYHTITEKDLNNEVLDLTKFKEISPITLANINIDTLILNKNDICHIQDIDLYDDVYIKKIKIVDSNDMKLNPYTVIPFNDNLDFHCKYILSDNSKILVYVDDENNLKIFDKDEILKDDSLSSIEFCYEKENIIIIYKYKKLGKYKIIIDYKEYDIDKLFTLYIKQNIFKYECSKSKKTKEYLENYDWVSLMEELISGNIFEKMYEDYLIFKNNLNKLHELGFSYRYFIYLHKRNLDSVINTMCSNDFNINNYTKDEIKDLNELGKRYTKKLK